MNIADVFLGFRVRLDLLCPSHTPVYRVAALCSGRSVLDRDEVGRWRRLAHIAESHNCPRRLRRLHSTRAPVMSWG